MEIINFIDYWQALIGAALGPFLLGIGFWIKEIIKARKERKEFLRRIEISITRSLDSIYKVREQLQKIAQRIKNLASDALAITDNVAFLSRVNFPPVRDVYRDVEVPIFKVKSYYLHNKLLWIDAGIKEVNEINKNFKGDFIELLRQNEMLVTLISRNPNPNFANQRKSYAENLKSFANEIGEYIGNYFTQGIEIMTQIKVYNGHLRRKSGFLFHWKHEGASFKYSRNKIEQEKFAKNLDLLEKIDLIIEKEVKTEIAIAEKRAAELSQK